MKKGLCIFITVACCVVIGVLCFFLGKTYSNCSKEKTDEPKTEVEKNTPIVVDANNFVYSYDQKTNIVVPKISGSTNTIKNINKKIDEDVLSGIISNLGYVYFDMGHEPDDCGPFTYTYKTMTKNDIIIIYAYSYDKTGNACDIPASGDGTYSYNYFYDIKNDKELTIGEAAKLLNLEDLDNAKTYEELNENACALIKIENNNLKVEAPLPDDCI